MKKIELPDDNGGTLAGNGIGIMLPRAGGRPAPCQQCGQALIRGPGISLCENLVCDSPPQINAPAASLEAWMGL